MNLLQVKKNSEMNPKENGEKRFFTWPWLRSQPGQQRLHLQQEQER
jgi:hypothetical protein